jgi:lactate dehydrogenase-like 2-hydroxyacid dehydrogenase
MSFFLTLGDGTGTWQGATTIGQDPQGKVLGILGMGGIGRVRLIGISS